MVCKESEFIIYYGIWEVQFKINKWFDSLSWSSVVKDFYSKRGYITGELNEEQEQAWTARMKKKYTSFFPLGFSVLLG